MDRQPVTSTSLRSAGYDAEKEVLEVEFHHGSVYQYEGVPADVFEELMNAESKGRYFMDEIRDVYPTTRVK